MLLRGPMHCAQAHAHLARDLVAGPRHPLASSPPLIPIWRPIPTDDQLARIAKVRKREFIRRGINQHTLEKICKGEPVRATKLAKCLEVLEQYELEQENNIERYNLVGRFT